MGTTAVGDQGASEGQHSAGGTLALFSQAPRLLRQGKQQRAVARVHILPQGPSSTAGKPGAS